MDKFFFSIVVLLVSIFIARVINNSANKTLSADKKAALIDLFSGGQVSTFAVIIGLMIIFFVSLKFAIFKPVIIYSFYIVASVIFLLIKNYMSYIKLKRNDFPDPYIKSYITSSILRLTGLVVFFSLLDF